MLRDATAEVDTCVSAYGYAAISGSPGPRPASVQRLCGEFGQSLPILRLLLNEAELALDGDPARARTALSKAVAVIEAEGLEGRPQIACGGLSPWQMKKALAYIEEQLERSIRVEDLASIVRLSSSHFSRAFRTSLGCTPQKYIVDQRVGRAKQLMITTNLALCEIALSCGFSDQAHLTRVFRARTAQTPGAWRRARQAA